MAKFESWIQDILWEQTIQGQHFPEMQILRSKGALSIENNDCRVIVQGVQEIYDKHTGAPWGDAVRSSKVVFIGKIYRFIILISICRLI